MDWVKRIPRRGASDGGWKDDFPLDHDLPETLTIDCRGLELPIYPLFAVRVRTFLEWHAAEGRTLRMARPDDARARDVFDGLGVSSGLSVDVTPSTATTASSKVVLPVTRLREFVDVESVAQRTRELLEYEMTDLSALGQASYMAVSELCGNAVEHGANRLGAFIAAARFESDRRQVSIAVGDLGMGIPEHLRQRFPEWFDDGHAVAQALEPGVSGTGHPHRGNGFTEAFEAVLASAGHAARVDIHAAKGFVRAQFYGGVKKLEPFPAASFRRGTWISYDVVGPD